MCNLCNVQCAYRIVPRRHVIFGGCNVHWGAAAEVLPSLKCCGNSREAGKHGQGHGWRVSRWPEVYVRQRIETKRTCQACRNFVAAIRECRTDWRDSAALPQAQLAAGATMGIQRVVCIRREAHTAPSTLCTRTRALVLRHVRVLWERSAQLHGLCQF